MRHLRSLLVLCTLATPAAAHDGPPYPILVDERLDQGLVLSVWADPDVGEGTFFYYIEGASSGTVRIDIESRSTVDPSQECRGTSEPAPERAPYQLVGVVPFDHRGTWHTRFVVRDADGVSLGEREVDLDVTPPGLGVVELSWFAIPFLACAAMWLRAVLAQRVHDREPGVTPPPRP